MIDRRAHPRILLLLVFICLPVSRGSAQERCGLGKDFVVRALERIKTGTTSEAEDALQLLKHATEQCASLGDAWYYRSLMERKLGRKAAADYALKKAQLFGSEGMEQSLDPFGLATGSEQPSAGDTRIVREKWALVIGVSRFQDRRIPKLRYTGKDAQDFAAVLRDSAYGRFQPDHVHLVLDEEATTKKIKAELNWLARSAAPEDLVVIYLASHGSPRELDTAGLNYIVTSDTEVKPEDNLFATALPMVELSDVVRSRIRARRTAIFLDTCHSGAALGASSASPEALDRIRQGAGRVIIASSQVNERSWESDTLQHGYFTYFLIQVLKQDQGLAPIDKIYEYVKEQVSKRVAADAKQRQTPVLSRSDRGAEIVVGVKPATAIAGGASASAER